MRLLALDTSSVACSVALCLGAEVTHRHEEQPREHTRLLLPMISSLLADSGARLEDLDAIVLGNGPGSFIGMRIAASVAQGLAHGAGLELVPVSSMAAVAAQVILEEGADRIVVAQDAHMNEVYLGLYRADETGLPVDVAAERLQPRLCVHGCIHELADEAGRFVAAGAGWQRYPELLEANRDFLAGTSGVLHPSARHLLPLAAKAWDKGAAVDPRHVVPAYLRHKVASKPAPDLP